MTTVEYLVSTSTYAATTAKIQAEHRNSIVTAILTKAAVQPLHSAENVDKELHRSWALV